MIGLNAASLYRRRAARTRMLSSKGTNRPWSGSLRERSTTRYLITQACQQGETHMRFFLDTANLDELRKGADWGIVDGVTTNPTLIAKEGVPLEEQIRRICDIVDGDISAEVISVDAPTMISDGLRLAKIHKNIVVKLPLIREGIKACSALSKE